jgi:ADP-ribosylglycohydrolase
VNASFASKIAGALYGGAIGDGMGAPVEGMLRQEILRLVGSVDGFIAPTAEVDGAWAFVERGDGKGDGRITDDTLMVEALLAAYAEQEGHLDACAYRDVFAPLVATRRVWVPEYQREMPVLDRLASAEQYHIKSLLKSHRDPRFFGALLFQITCGAAMFAWPIGAANAGDPQGAYDEAQAFFAAQTFSFGLDQAAVMAAAMAAALAPNATARTVVDAAVAVARDATREMILLATGAVSVGADRDRDLPAIRAAVQGLHHKRTHITDLRELDLPSRDSDRASNRGLESRLHGSEELPVALALVLRAGGDPRESICAGVEYGEDADSIAAMAGSIAGALRGCDALPLDWRRQVDAGNRRDYAVMAEDFVGTLRKIHQKDIHRHRRRAETMGATVG